MKMYSIKDTVRNTFNFPFVDENDATAKRDFINSAVKSPYRSDLALFKLGDFDIDTGVVTALPEPCFICYFEEPVKDE